MSKIKKVQYEIAKHSGIDFGSYRDEDLQNKIEELLIFPKYIAKVFLKWILTFIAVFAILTTSLFLFDKSVWQIMFFCIFGLLFCILAGIFSGAIGFIKLIFDDFKIIIEKVAEISKNIIEDILESILSAKNTFIGDVRKINNETIDTIENKAKDFVNSKLKEKDITTASISLSDIFSGVLLLIVYPTIESFVSRRIKFLALILIPILSRIFLLVNVSVRTILSIYDEKIRTIENSVTKKVQTYTNNITKQSGDFIEQNIKIIKTDIVSGLDESIPKICKLLTKIKNTIALPFVLARNILLVILAVVFFIFFKVRCL